MDGLRVAVFAKLNSDTALTDMLATTTSIYHRRMPLSAAFPVIVLDKQSGMSEWTFKGGALSNQVWMIKAVDRWPSASRAEDIDKRIGQVMNDSVLTLSDGTLLYLRRESDVDYEEGSDPDYTIHHVGGLYRIRIDRS